jgi:hypothetical protein
MPYREAPPVPSVGRLDWRCRLGLHAWRVRLARVRVCDGEVDVPDGRECLRCGGVEAHRKHRLRTGRLVCLCPGCRGAFGGRDPRLAARRGSWAWSNAGSLEPQIVALAAASIEADLAYLMCKADGDEIRPWPLVAAMAGRYCGG